MSVDVKDGRKDTNCLFDQLEGRRSVLLGPPLSEAGTADAATIDHVGDDNLAVKTTVTQKGSQPVEACWETKRKRK